MNLEISIKICPALNISDNYSAFITSQMQNAPETVKHHHAPMGASAEEIADWVASNVKHHIIAMVPKMKSDLEKDANA